MTNDTLSGEEKLEFNRSNF